MAVQEKMYLRRHENLRFKVLVLNPVDLYWMPIRISNKKGPVFFPLLSINIKLILKMYRFAVGYFNSILHTFADRRVGVNTVEYLMVRGF